MAENEICVREDKVKILSLDAEEKPRERGQLKWSVSFTTVIGSGMVMWFRLVQWYSTLKFLVSCGREAQKLFSETA